MNSFLRLFIGCLLLAPLSLSARNDAERLSFFPKLRVGQVIRYQVGFRSTTNTTTESAVSAPMAPTGGQTNANVLLRIQVEDVRSDAGEISARLRVQVVDANLSAASGGAPLKNAQTPDVDAESRRPGKTVMLTLHRDGRISDVQGLDGLALEERAAWQEWVARFAGAAPFPENGVRLGETWKREEPVPNAMLAGLSWEKESQYVSNAPCAALMLTRSGDPSAARQPPETCAVILTTAILRQKSSPKDATPEDYKLHDLRNMGTARGKNQIISYFSLKSGLVVRATEDANQSMNLTVAETDGSNRVHYTIDAESHAQVLLLADPSAGRP